MGQSVITHYSDQCPSTRGCCPCTLGKGHFQFHSTGVVPLVTTGGSSLCCIYAVVLSEPLRTPQGPSTRPGAYPAEVSPVQQVAEALGAVPLDDALPTALLAELEQEGGELVARLVHAPKPPVQNVNTFKKQTNIKTTYKCN